MISRERRAAIIVASAICLPMVLAPLISAFILFGQKHDDMRQVILTNNSAEWKEPIAVGDCTMDKVYFMRHGGCVYQLHSAMDSANRRWYSWQPDPTRTYGGPCKSLQEALTYARELGATVYQFDDWNEAMKGRLP